MISFIYSFDKNYNFQAFISIMSLLEKVNEKINIFILHNNKNSFSHFLETIEKNKFLNLIVIEELEFSDFIFSNTDNKHVTEATYYRLFLDRAFEKYEDELKNVVYLDADIVCKNNPIPYAIQVFKELTNSNKLVAARTEILNIHRNYEFFDKFDNNNSVKYFNAGVLYFDYKFWIENSIFNKTREMLNRKDLDFEFWDQDLLNNFFEGNYLEISNLSNFALNVKWHIQKKTLDQSIFIHYQGNRKPWHIANALKESSIYFHDEVKKFHNKSIYLSSTGLRNDIYGFFKTLLSVKSYKNPYFADYLKESILIMFKNLINF